MLLNNSWFKYLLLLLWVVALISYFAPEWGAKEKGAFSCKYHTHCRNIFFSCFLLSVHRSSQHLQQLNGLASMFQHQDAEVKPCCCVFPRMWREVSYLLFILRATAGFLLCFGCSQYSRDTSVCINDGQVCNPVYGKTSPDVCMQGHSIFYKSVLV